MSSKTTAADGIERGDPVDTPIGTMYLRHVGWGVLIDNSSNTIPHVEGRPYLTLAGKEFTASLGFYPDGELERCYVHKRGSYDDAAPSYTARIVEEGRKAALAYIAENPDKVAAGELYSAKMDVYSAQAAYDRVRPEYLEAIRKLDDASQRLAEAEAKAEAFA